MEVQSHDANMGSAESEPLDPDRTVELYRSMLRARVIDARLRALGEEGRIGFLPSTEGREAAVIGALAGLDDGDWVFPTVHDWAAALHRGMSVSTFVSRVFGNAADPLLGRDMPGGLSAKGQHIASVSAPAATHLPHAVGVAWAARQRGEPLVSAAFFEGREVDAADFHTGLNFAGVMKAPTLFLCRLREGEEGAAEHAVAYGLDHVSCDGSDLPAVYAAVADAAARARRGLGATVVDLVLGDDPIERTRGALVGLGAWSDARDAELTEATENELASAIDAAARAGEPSLRSLFDDVFEALPPHLEAQRDAALES